MAAHGPGAGRHFRRPAAQVVAPFHGGLPARFHHADAVQAGPFSPVGEPADRPALPVAAGFHPPVAFVHLRQRGEFRFLPADRVVQIGAHLIVRVPWLPLSART